VSSSVRTRCAGCSGLPLSEMKTRAQILKFLLPFDRRSRGKNLKEYTHGVESAGRKSDFDPKIDPIVRVQKLRLRVKLKEYYFSLGGGVEGKHDPFLIQIPKGITSLPFEVVINSNANLCQ